MFLYECIYDFLLTDLIEDWSATGVSDIYHFVPYTWTINLLIKDFELILLANEYNWIDTSSQTQETGVYY